MALILIVFCILGTRELFRMGREAERARELEKIKREQAKARELSKRQARLEWEHLQLVKEQQNQHSLQNCQS